MAREAAHLGLEDVRILLADVEQRMLIPFTGDRTAPPSPDELIAIDGSLAGRAYRTEARVIGEPVDGRTTAWFPLLDSAERLGVFVVTVAGTFDDTRISETAAFTSLVGELVASKDAYGDAIARARRTRPMTLSAEMRWTMLPPLTYTGRNLTISAVLEPAYEIAGDTFDYAVNGDVAHVAIIDAIGHGLEAARIANLAVGAYRHGRRHGTEAVDLYRAMDAAIAGQFGGDKFATAQLAELTLSTGHLRWLNAGHPPPLLLRQLHCTDLTSDVSLPIGLALEESDRPPQPGHVALEPGDLVLFFSDGVIEARSPDGVEFGRERLGDLLARVAASAQPPAEIVRSLSHAVLDHQEGVLEDDGTLLLLVWHGPSSVIAAPDAAPA